MKINELFKNVNFSLNDEKFQADQIEIKNLQYDSRKVDADSLFFAFDNGYVNAIDYFDDAYNKNCRYFVISKDDKEKIEFKMDACYVLVDNVNEAFAICSSNFYGNPSKDLKLIGVTGTNGKTTITSLVERCLKKLDKRMGLIGTIENHVCDKVVPSQNTTPFSDELHRLFKDMKNEKCDYVVMEIGSHSYPLKRIFGLEFEVGVFTNLTQDHLDYHKTMENYRDAKLGILNMAKKVIINADTPYSKYYIDNCNGEIFTYGINEKADFMASNINITLFGSEFDVKYKDDVEHLKIKTPGDFSVYNALAAVGTLVVLGFDIHEVCNIMNILDGVTGRFQTFTSNKGFSVVVDYAHTPDGLKNILETAKKFVKGRIITVFGCGGDRDRTKRPIMGKITVENSDFTVVTSDNPRTEDLNQILNDIEEGIKDLGKDYIIEADRLTATTKAIEMAKENDLVIIAGKGHEDYQLIGHEKIHYSDIEVVQELLKK